MSGTTLIWEKRTGTYADALAAVGLAVTLSALTGEDVEISDCGHAYLLQLEKVIDFDQLDYRALQQAPGFRFIKTPKWEADAPPDSVDYMRERERLLAYRKMREDLRKNPNADDEVRRMVEEAAPLGGRLGRWYTIQNMNVLGAVDGVNKLHRAIREADPGEFARYISERLKGLAACGPEPGAAIREASRGHGALDLDASSLQVFNPTVGKGVSRPKAIAASPSSLPGYFVDWFEEWMKYVGMENAGRLLGIGKDVKAAVIAPMRVRVRELRVQAENWLNLMPPWSPIKFDIYLVIGMARILLEKSEFTAEGGGGWRRRSPRSILAGMHTAHFKSMGTSRSLFNTSFMALPGWIPATDRESVAAWLEVLDEHWAVLRPLDEDKSEDAEILKSYRDFLSSPSTEALCGFFSDFGIYAMRKLASGKPCRRFTMELFEKVVEQVNSTLADLVKNPAFQEIAAAIRKATVTEQAHKRNGTQEFEIHYGLLPELRRKAQFPEQFIAALSDFIAKYNAETARHFETGRGKRRRARVSAEALEGIVPLILEHGQPAALLLIAYATCRARREDLDEATASFDGDDMGDEYGDQGDDGIQDEDR